MNFKCDNCKCGQYELRRFTYVTWAEKSPLADFNARQGRIDEEGIGYIKSSPT